MNNLHIEFQVSSNVRSDTPIGEKFNVHQKIIPNDKLSLELIPNEVRNINWIKTALLESTYNVRPVPQRNSPENVNKCHGYLATLATA